MLLNKIIPTFSPSILVIVLVLVRYTGYSISISAQNDHIIIRLQ